jgi:outer membrane receptor protein involved in Fe transport
VTNEVFIENLKYAAESGTDYSGNRMVLAPKLNLSGLVRKAWSLGAGELSAQTNWRYVDDTYHGVANDPVELIKDNTVVDARLSYVFGEREHMEVALWGTNLGDERFCVSIGTVPAGLAQCVPNEPRSYGLYGSIKF